MIGFTLAVDYKKMQIIFYLKKVIGSDGLVIWAGGCVEFLNQFARLQRSPEISTYSMV